MCGTTKVKVVARVPNNFKLVVELENSIILSGSETTLELRAKVLDVLQSEVCKLREEILTSAFVGLKETE
jgi:hypothetical protein